MFALEFLIFSIDKPNNKLSDSFCLFQTTFSVWSC